MRIGATSSDAFRQAIDIVGSDSTMTDRLLQFSTETSIEKERIFLTSSTGTNHKEAEGEMFLRRGADAGISNSW
jgi:hypothetical protein